MAFRKWFTASPKDVAEKQLMHVCLASSNINSAVTEVPDYLREVRASVMKYLFNAMFYNVNYKDLALTNIEHMTNFFMYPMVTSETATPNVYPFYESMFANTSLVNGGYLSHCFSVVIDNGLRKHPFVTRRDFDLLLIHKILTGEVQLSLTICRSYLFKGKYNPLADVYKCFLMTAKMNMDIPREVSQWTIAKDRCTMSVPAKLNERALRLGLMCCSGNVQYWTPSKVRNIIDLSPTIDLQVDTIKVSSGSLFENTKGVYQITPKRGLIVNTRECHPYVYVWDENGVHRFENIADYLYSDLGVTTSTVTRLISK